MDVTRIVVALIGLLSTLITSFLIPLIKSKIDSNKADKIVYWINVAVNAAEQLFPESGSGECKKEYVNDFVNSVFNKLGMSVDEQVISNMIEASVFNLGKKN